MYIKISFREKHILQIFENYEKQSFPLDLFLNHYFRQNKSLGANDRRWIYEKVYILIRWRGLIDHLCEKPLSWEKRLAFTKKFDPWKTIDDETIPFHIRVSFPKGYFQLIADSYGEEKAFEICKVCNEQAPTTLRVNPLKTTRDELHQLLEKRGLEVSKTTNSPLGLFCHKRENFFALEEFKLGYFEVQDEGSQLISLLIKPNPDDQVLDYCAGSGGKTLAFAWQMEGRGQIYLHDVRQSAYTQAKKRMNRAGIQNYQFLYSASKKMKMLKNRIDWLLLDVPCSGSGTLRRNPDMKWRFHPKEDIEELVRKQRMIFDESFPFIKEGGKIVYATCSIFPKENEEQINYFLENYPVKLVEKSHFWLPERGQMDGFFGAVLERTSG